jgi:hypothetical protein
MHIGFVRLARVFTLSLSAMALLPACPGCNPVVVDGGLDCAGDDDCADGQRCSDEGLCVAIGDGDGGVVPDAGDGDGDGDGDAGTSDGGYEEPVLIREPDVNNPQNPFLDSDCDGISDADEFGTEWPGGLRTDPANWDSDDDGIPDGVEAGKTETIDAECPFVYADQDPTTKTNPTAVDTDGDCIPDGLEDKNRNGLYEPLLGETNPNSIDSDGDGIDDGDEDTNCNGVVDPGETNPGDIDSDGDGINDGVELLIGTDPTNPDTDGDGIPDGVELQNGTDPKVAEQDSDGDGIIDAVEVLIGTDPDNADTDGDGLCDGALSVVGVCEAGEDLNANGFIDPGESDPLTPDTDCDGVSDGDERLVYQSDPLDDDTDGDGIVDGVEVGRTSSPDADCVFVGDADPSTTTSPTLLDTDGDGKNDGVEDLDRNGALAPANPGGIQETDASHADTDLDGFCDGPNTVTGVCVAGEDLNRDGRVNGSETDPRVPDLDSDGDGIPDDKEVAFGGAPAGYDPASPDTDGDGLCDGPGTVVGVCVAGEDMNANGVLDANETRPNDADSDCDAISDLEERQIGTNPRLADTDNDGIRDGVEVGKTTTVSGSACVGVLLDANPAADHNSNPLLADTDGDGIPDGLEDRNRDGAIAPPGGSPQETYPANADSDGDGFCDGPLSVAGVCVAGEDLNFNGIVDFGETDPRVPDIDSDLDGWSDVFETTVTFTNPFNPDSDGDGLCDGAIQVGACTGVEDTNGNGIVDVGETNPRDSDSDCDGLSDGLERQIGTNPRRLDTDNDLIPDGIERGITGPASGVTTCTNPPIDADPSTTTNPLSADTDGDGKNDGLEDLNRNGALGPPSAPGPQETDPNDPDTDDDGLCDGPITNIVGVCSGGEDRNMNGIVDGNETDPRQADVDEDNDGLTTPQEIALGTNPLNPDTDNDGLLDGEEVLTTNTDPLRWDTDCDGLSDGQEVNWTPPPGPDPNNPDTDGDGLPDGLEAGTTCVQTNLDPVCVGVCVPDADPSTTTNPVSSDSDGDGLSDGVEDANQNGAVDPGELSPTIPIGQDPAAGDPNSAIADINACGAENLKLVNLITRADTTADMILAALPTFNEVTEVRDAGGNSRGIMVFNPTTRVAGFAIKFPGIAGVDIGAKLTTLEGQIAGAGALSNPIARNFTTWDGFAARSSIYNYADTGNHGVKRSATDIVSALVAGATGTLPGTDEIGPFKIQLLLVNRSNDSAVLVGALTNVTQYDASELRQFDVDDLTNGSALAQFGDRTGVQCDRLEVQPRQIVDFVLVIDNSGSMDNEQNAVSAAAAQIGAQLSASTVDWRIAVITSDLDALENNVNRWEACDHPRAGGGVCRTANGTLVANVPAVTTQTMYCPFTTSVADLTACVDDININGNGEENFFRAFSCAVGRNVSGDGITQNILAGGLGGAVDGESCGRDNNRAPYAAGNTFAAPPGDFAFLPRAANNTKKFRTGANVVVVFITDANEQSDGRYLNTNTTEAVATQSVPAWVSFFQNFDGLGLPESHTFVAGLVCPVGTNCTDETGNYSNARFRNFLATMNGIEAALPPDTDAQQAQKIQDAISAILAAAIGNVSPYVLSKPPISSTIKVALDPTTTTEGTCNKDDVPRSRLHGWDYDGTNNTIGFFGNCRPLADQVGKRVAVSYRYWIENSPNPDGNPDPCADCDDPYICINDQCVCPSNCGLPGGVPFGYTCNTATCALACLADCGGCPSGQQCNVGTCACACPANCGGAPPSPAMTCNQTTCEYECLACDANTRPSADSTCNFSTCQWNCANGCTGTAPPGTFCNTSASVCAFTCQADCGGCPNGAQCNTASCACECSDCGGVPPGDDFSCNIDTCAWECSGLPDEGTRPGPNFVWDTTLCDWACPDDCGGNDPGGAYACDATMCEWTCPLDCGGCAGGNTCNTTACACECPANCGSPQPGANYACNQSSCAWECTDTPNLATRPGPNFVWDATQCKWTCPSDCGTGSSVTAPFACNALTCEVTCQADCGGLCGQYESCNTSSCGCECNQTANCAAGFVFDAASCGCVCDTTQNCGDTRALDVETCSCKCKTGANGLPDCGGCDVGFICQPSLCECRVFGGG